MAPEDVIRKIFDVNTHMVSSIEAEIRDVPQRHIKSRLPFLTEKELMKHFTQILVIHQYR